MSGEQRKTKVGTVVSSKMEKTAVVKVQRIFTHPMFKKQVKRTKNYKVHDPQNECKPGDKILMEETRPISKDKCWRLIKILGRVE